jgi:hypothetical protein
VRSPESRFADKHLVGSDLALLGGEEAGFNLERAWLVPSRAPVLSFPSAARVRAL